MSGKIMRQARALILAGGVLLLAGSAGAATIIVDDFSSATTSLMANPLFGCGPGSGVGTCFIDQMNVAEAMVGSINAIDSPLADVLGGSRSLTVFADSLQSVTPPDLVVAGVVPVASFLDYNSTAQADGRINLLYDGGGMGLGLVLALSDSVRVEMLDADDAAVTCPDPPMACELGYRLTVTIRDSAMQSASLTRTVLLPGGPVTVGFPFSSFAGINGVNLGNIFSVELAMDPNTAGDLRLDRIELSARGVRKNPVPLLSPLSIAALAITLTFLGWRTVRVHFRPI